MHLRLTALLFFGSLCLLGGCAQKTFVKAGASTQDFTTDKYACERDARQSGGFGTGLIGAMEVQGYFNRCMSSHGWDLQGQEQIDATRQQNGARLANFKSRRDEMIEKSKICVSDIRSIPKYKTISQHFPKVGGLTIAQKSDGNLPTIPESKIYLDYVEHIQVCTDQMISGTSEFSPSAAVIFKENANSSNEIASRLIRREISWGASAVLQEKNIAETLEKLKKVRIQ